MAQIPEIRPEVNKEPEDRKKKAGLFARLFGGGTSGGGLGAGGLGGAGGGFGGAAAGGGLLATKAGLLAFILAGSTVAAGIGLVGYRVFGPGSDAGSGDGSLSIFAPKPKETASPDAQAPKDGNSQSLSMLAQGNQDLKKGDAAAAAPGGGSETPKDETAASAAQTADKAGGGSINGEASGGSGAAKGLLKGGSRFGELSKGVGGGGGPAVTAGNSSGKLVDPASAVASAKGALGGKFANGGRAAQGGRSIAGRRAGAALHQAIGALGDQKGALSSYSAGRTYDGSAANNGSAIGPEAGAPGVGGPGDSAAPQPKSLQPNSANQLKDIKAPPTPTPKMVAPWQGAINTAKMLIGIAAIIALIGYMLKGEPWFRPLKMWLGGVMIALGLMVVALGAQVAGGKYGQTLQGGVLAAAGIGLTVMGAAMMYDADKGKASVDGENDSATGAGDWSSGTDQTGNSASAGNSSNLKVSNGIGGVNPLVALGGGTALIGLCASMMIPPKKYPSTDFQNGKPPDSHWFGYRQMPSEKAVVRYLV